MRGASRRYGDGRVAAVFLLVFGLLLCGLCRAAAAQADPREIGVVKSVVAPAGLIRAGRDGEGALAVGDSLRLDDRIVTGPGGSVGFTLNDGARFSIGPNSAIVIAEFRFEPSRSLLSMVAELLFGTLIHSTGEIGRIKPEAVEIKTPLGTVGVRGTRFAVLAPRP